MAGDSVKSRNALAVVSPPRGKAPLAKPCKLVALAVCLLVTTLFMLQNVYVWCEEASQQRRADLNASGPVKALLCIASQRYTGISTASSDFLRSLLSSGERQGSAAEDAVSVDVDVREGSRYVDGQPNVRSWKSQWIRRNLSVESEPAEEVRGTLEVWQLEALDTRGIPGKPAGCSRLPGPALLGLPSHGTLSCPVLWECKAASKVRALCWNPEFLDAYRPASLPTEGGSFRTPKLGEALVTNYQEHLGAVVLMQHVYCNPYAQVFDSRRLFFKGGCWEKRNPVFQGDNHTTVVRVQLAINLCSSHADSQFHGLVELLSRVALLLPAIQALPTARLLITHRDYPYVSVMFQILGFPAGLDAFHVQLLRPNEVAHADMLLLAQSPSCGQSSASVWRHIRRDYFKLPMDGRTALEKQADWYLVLAERKGSRNIVQHQELLAGLVDALGEARVKVFSDRVQWTMADTQRLYRDAAILVGAHGAGLSNMVFMPQLASVLEIRPANFSNTCYHMLADSLRFNYYRFDSPGVKSSSLVVDVEQVVRLVSAIVRAKGRPVQFYDELATWRRLRR